MADEELSYDQQRAQLKRETQRALLEGIKVAASKSVSGEDLKFLAEAYAVVMGTKVPPSEEKPQQRGRVVSF